MASRPPSSRAAVSGRAGRVPAYAGVVNAVSGYAGGSKVTAGYTMVSTGTTPRRIGRDSNTTEEDQLRQDLQIFFSVRARSDPIEIRC